MHLGIVLAFGYTIFSSLNYLKMREMGNQIHSAIKTYYFGLLCTSLSLVYATYMDPTILKLWLIGTPYYPISLAQFTASLGVGFFSWANQECLSLCLTVVKQGTSSAFNIIALLVSLATDSLYFGRFLSIHDIIGSGLIIIFTIIQSIIANKAGEENEDEEHISFDMDSEAIKSSPTNSLNSNGNFINSVNDDNTPLLENRNSN